MTPHRIARINLACLVTFVLASYAEGNASKANPTVNISDEQKLFGYLMEHYDKNTRPVYNASHPVVVSVGISLTKIFDLGTLKKIVCRGFNFPTLTEWSGNWMISVQDEKNQLLTTNIWLDQTWRDEKLTWDPAEFNGIVKIRIPCRHIWLPDIILYNSANDYTDEYMQALAMVSHDGTVFWPPIVRLRSTCQIDITYYPFDDQICKLKMGSWAYDGLQVDVINNSDSMQLADYVKNGEWDLLEVKAVRNVKYYPCCPEPFPDVTFYVHIRRRTLYYMYNVIGPCIMLSVLTVLIFWMRPESGEKLTLGLTVLLAFSVFMLLIAENMPATSSFVPLISIYFTTIMSLTCVSVVVAVVVSNINHRGQAGVPLPQWLRSVINIMGKVVCMRLTSVNYIGQENERQNSRIYAVPNDSCDSGYPLTQYEETGDAKDARANWYSPNIQTNRIHSAMRDISHRLDDIIKKDQERDKSDTIIRQWQEAAEIVDRFLFWVFVTLTILSSVFLLAILPSMKLKNAM